MSNWSSLEIPEIKSPTYPLPDINTLLIDAQNIFTSIFPGINVDAYTPEGQIITALVHRERVFLSKLVELENTYFLGAEGVMLDYQVTNNFRMTRRPASNGTVAVTIEGTPLTKVEKGFKVSDGVIEFELIDDVFIPIEGKRKADFMTVEFTTHIAKANTIKNRVTPLLNVTNVYNEQDSSPGIPEESDAMLKRRALRYGIVANNGTFKGIMSCLHQIPGVIKINGYENPTSDELTYQQQAFPAHSVGFVVYGGSDTDIAKLLQESKPPGCAMVGDQSVDLAYQNHSITYKFFRPKPVEMKVELTVAIDSQSPSNYEDIAKEAVKSYIASLGIGESLVPIRLACSVTNDTRLSINDVKASRTSESLDTRTATLSFTEMATISDANITIKKQS